MKDAPNISGIAALIGDPARANILTALMSGKALTATELAHEAGVSPQTASSHLKQLEQGQLLTRRRSGRHNYFTLASDDVAHTLEALMGLALGAGHLRSRPGPRDAAMRKARVCYNHLAGEMGVRMFQSMQAQGFFDTAPNGLKLSQDGEVFVATLGLDLSALPPSRAPFCRECLDWSARQSHLAGQLGRALLTHFLNVGWVQRAAESRTLHFTQRGEEAFDRHFGPGLA